MTTIRKVKKWHIVVLIILGIGGYWISQNMWVFEKQVPIERYKDFISNSVWVSSSGAKWKFNSNGVLQLYDIIDYSTGSELWYEEDKWDVEGENLMLKTEVDYTLRPWSIVNLTKNYMEINQDGKRFKLDKK